MADRPAAGYFAVKGIRDIVLGLNLLALFALGQRRATGVLMAITSLIPIIDMITVLTHDGPVATALGVHGLTAASCSSTPSCSSASASPPPP